MESSKNCSANALEWFAFLAALVLMLVPWWLAEIPDIFTKPKSHHHEEQAALQQLHDDPVEQEPLNEPPPYSLEPEHPPAVDTSWSGRGRRFLHAVQWNCLRCIQPGYLAIYSFVRSRDHRTWPALYYFGHDPGHPTKLGMWHWAKILGTDMLALCLQALLIYIGTTNFDKEGKLLPGWWVMGLMPPTVTGLFIIGLSFLPRVPGLKTTVFWGAVFHAVFATAIIVPAAHTPKSLGAYKSPSSFGSIIAFQWFLMLSPMAMYKCPGPAAHLVFVILATVLRGAPLAIAMGSSSKDFPFCIDNIVALPIAFGLVQCGGVFILACFSSLRCERNRASMKRRTRLHDLGPWPLPNSRSREHLTAVESHDLEVYPSTSEEPRTNATTKLSPAANTAA